MISINKCIIPVKSNGKKKENTKSSPLVWLKKQWVDCEKCIQAGTFLENNLNWDNFPDQKNRDNFRSPLYFVKV